MKITIEIDTKDALSDEDKAILRAVGYMDNEGSAAPASAPTAASKPAKKTAAPAKKAAAAPSPEPEPASEPEADESSPEADTDLRDAAVARASELLSSGGRDRVMAALKAAGAKKVSEVAEEDLQDFITALDD